MEQGGRLQSTLAPANHKDSPAREFREVSMLNRMRYHVRGKRGELRRAPSEWGDSRCHDHALGSEGLTVLDRERERLRISLDFNHLSTIHDVWNHLTLEPVPIRQVVCESNRPG